MRIDGNLSDGAILSELGQRIERYRLGVGITQANLAQEAGISKRTVERIESGASCEMIMLIRILRVLRLSEALNTLIPEIHHSPIAQLKLQGRERKRVGSPRKPESEAKPEKTNQASTNKARPSTSPPISKWKWGQ